MTAERYQRIVVWFAVLYLYMVMLVSGVTFAVGRTRTIEILTSQGALELTSLHFAVLSFIAAYSAILQLLPSARRLSSSARACWYTGSAVPLILYTVPVAQQVARSGVATIGVVVYLVVFFSFVVIAAAAFRPKFS